MMPSKAQKKKKRIGKATRSSQNLVSVFFSSYQSFLSFAAGLSMMDRTLAVCTEEGVDFTFEFLR